MNILFVALLIAIIDLPWLLLNMGTFQTIFTKIQGGETIKFRLIYAVPVYIALAYLVSISNSITESWFIGAATYAVYDFTMLTAFKHYPLWLGIIDSIWGGTLLALTYYVLEWFSN